MAVERNEKGHLLKGSDLNRKYTKEEAVKLFEAVSKSCMTGDYLSIQEAQVNSGIKHRTFYDLVKRFPEVKEIHDQMRDAIAATVNRRGLEGDYSAAMAIFRLKQFGETDKIVNEVSIKEQPLFAESKKRKKK